jgi:hypothetical protein
MQIDDLRRGQAQHDAGGVGWRCRRGSHCHCTRPSFIVTDIVGVGLVEVNAIAGVH